MKFPLISLATQNWDNDDFGYLLEGEIIDFKTEKQFQEYYQDGYFCDCEGQVFQLMGRRLITESGFQKVWRILSKQQASFHLEFKKMNKKLDIEQLREHIAKQIKASDTGGYADDWSKFVEQATTYEAIIGSESLF